MSDHQKKRNIESIVGLIMAAGGTAANIFYNGMEQITPDQTMKDVYYFSNAEYGRMAAGIGAGMAVDGVVSKAFDKVPFLSEKQKGVLKGLGTIALVTAGHAAVKCLTDGNFDNYLSQMASTLYDYGAAAARVYTHDPRAVVQDIGGAAVLAINTYRVIKNLVG